MRRLPVVALLSLCATACTPKGSASDGETPAQGAELANVRGQTLSDECPNGGVDIELGIDENADGQLSADEVDRVVTVCNGIDGADGDAGPQGTPGDDGTSCTVVDNGDGTKTITCGDASVTVSDGVDAPAPPPCGVVEGSVTIENALDVQALAGCTGVSENLTISAIGLTSIAALSSLTSVGGSLIIEGNNALTTLSGLENVTSVGGTLNISSNSALTSLNGLEGLQTVGIIQIGNNDRLLSLSGLDNLASISNQYDHPHPIQIQGNDALASIAALPTSITFAGDVQFFDNHALRQCDIDEWLTASAKTCTFCSRNRVCGPVCTGDFTLFGDNLSYMKECVSITGNLTISYARTMAGLENLESVEGDIVFQSTSSTPLCEMLNFVSQVGRDCAVDATCDSTGYANYFVTCECGNGVRNLGEGCDDGNTDASDGCSDACEVEANYTCSFGVYTPDVCYL